MVLVGTPWTRRCSSIVCSRNRCSVLHILRWRTRSGPVRHGRYGCLDHMHCRGLDSARQAWWYGCTRRQGRIEVGRHRVRERTYRAHPCCACWRRGRGAAVSRRGGRGRGSGLWIRGHRDTTRQLLQRLRVEGNLGRGFKEAGLYKYQPQRIPNPLALVHT